MADLGKDNAEETDALPSQIFIPIFAVLGEAKHSVLSQLCYAQLTCPYSFRSGRRCNHLCYHCTHDSIAERFEAQPTEEGKTYNEGRI